MDQSTQMSMQNWRSEEFFAASCEDTKGFMESLSLAVSIVVNVAQSPRDALVEDTSWMSRK